MQKVSAWSGLFSVITAPAQTFETLRERMPVLPGYLVQMATGLLAFALALPLTLTLITEQAAKAGIPAAQANITRWGAIGGGIFTAAAMPWIAGVVIAGIAMFFGTFNGAGVGFGTYLGMLGYARLPLALQSILGGIMARQATSMKQASQISISLAALVPPDASPVLRAFLATLSPFDLWYYALLAIGFAALHRTKLTKSLPLVVTLYVIGLLFTIYSSMKAAQLAPMM